MITSLKDWKKLNEMNTDIRQDIGMGLGMGNANQPIQSDPNPVPTVDTDTKNNIIKVGEYAKSLDLSKQQTINLINTVFIDPAQAPEDISVAFVQDHLGEITTYIESLPDSEFSEQEYKYNKEIETNELPFECVMFIPNNAKIQKLTETLNTQIKKENFKAIYENGIFFINSLEKLNDNNKKIVLDILKECSAKNISNSLKWTRKIQ